MTTVPFIPIQIEPTLLLIEYIASDIPDIPQSVWSHYDICYRGPCIRPLQMPTSYTSITGPFLYIVYLEDLGVDSG